MAMVESRRRIGRALFGAGAIFASTLVTGAVVQAAEPSLIGGVVWNDVNADGLRDASEPGLASVTLVLQDTVTDAQVGDPVVSAADGSYVFTPLEAGTYRVVVQAPSNRLVSIATAENAFTPDGGSASVNGSSSDLTIEALDSAVVANLAIRPRPELSIGSFGPGVLDGSSPFNVSGSCTSVVSNPTPTGGDEWSDTVAPGQQPGDDCGSQNGIVRSQESIATIWSITADNYEPGAGDLANVIFEQIIHTGPGALADFERIPVSCVAPPSGSGGTTPVSTITYNDPNPGDTKLTCNLGSFPEGFQESLTSFIQVSGESVHGSQIWTEQRVYSLDANGVDNAVPGDAPQVGPITVSAAPAYDVGKDRIGILNYGPRDLDMKFDDHLPDCVAPDTTDCNIGSEPGLYGYFMIDLAAQAESGIEALQQPFTLDDNFFATTDSPAAGTPYTGYEFEVTECRYNPSGWGNTVYGRETTSSSWSDAWVTDSGTCTPQRSDPSDPTSQYDLVLNNVDMSGTDYPTRTYNGSDLSAGPFYVAMHRVQFFIPNRSIDMSDGVMDNVGSLQVSNCIDNFDPVGISGNSNFGSGFEPGYNRSATADGAGSNNCAGPTTFELRVAGSFSKYNYNYIDTNGYPRQPSGFTSHTGSQTYEPTQSFVGVIWNRNHGTQDLFDPVSCDVFDNTSMKLTTAEAVGKDGWTPTYLAAGSYAYINNGYSWNTDNDPADFVVEYASADFGTDDPMSGGFNPVTSRYEGDWSVARQWRCDDNATNTVDGVTYGLTAPNAGADPDGDGWTTDPTAFPGGIDSVNMVRGRLANETIPLAPNDRIALTVPLEARNVFNGGPYDGELLPAGLVMPNFGGARWSHYADGQWTSRNYQPSPETSHSDGDRMTLTRAQLRIKQRTITPVADVGITGSTLAGSQIVWELLPTLISNLDDPTEVDDIKIVEVLPATVAYNAACTAALEGGTLPALIELDTPNPGETTLTWLIAEHMPNTDMTPIRICTDSDPLSPNGTTVVAEATITSPAVAFAAQVQTDDHTVLLEQNGSVQLSKTVDVTLDDQNDTQVFGLEWTNFAASFPILAPTIIDVFSYNGDGVGSLSARSPESDFSGAYELVGAPTTVFSDGSVPGATDPFAAIGVWTYSSDDPATIDINPDMNASFWCLEANFGLPGCPTDFASVTAIKFVSNYALDRDGNPRQGMKATYTMSAGDSSAGADPARTNEPGDRYTNRFALDTASLQASQFLRSNPVTVEVAAFSIGDFVFSDINGDGNYDSLTESAVPDGVTIQLRRSGTDQLVTSMVTGSGDDDLGAGRYLFDLLASGSYYVSIPASDFAADAVLDGWVTSVLTADSDENDDNNEDVDQHAFSPGTPLANGVRSDELTLSATAPLPGEKPVGHEPVGDNTGGLADFTQDDFSNLTLDLGLVGPAEIEVDKEICTQEPVSDCDIDDDAHWAETFEVEFFETARWRITVTNPGLQLLTDLELSDAQETSCDLSYIDEEDLEEFYPGDVYVYTCDSDDVLVGFINEVEVEGTNALGQAEDDSDPASVSLATSEPEIAVEKATNGADADSAPGVYVIAESAVVWTYAVTNPGNMPLRSLSLVDDNGTPGDTADDITMTRNSAHYVSGDIDDDHRLDLTETWLFTLSGTAAIGQYTNNVVVEGTPILPGLDVVEDDDPSNHFGINNAGIQIEKATSADVVGSPTSDEDADTGTGYTNYVGSGIVWTYLVSTTGQSVPLSDVVVVDDAGTAGTSGDDFNPIYVSGDDGDDVLESGETWLYTASGVATEGQYENTATVTARAPATTPSAGMPLEGAEVEDTDLSHYLGMAAAVEIVKSVNGDDANSEPGPMVITGNDVLFTYEVTNTGDLALVDLEVSDDKGVAVTCPATFLESGDSMTCTGSASATSGQYVNVGSVIGTPALAGVGGQPPVALINQDGTLPPKPTDSDEAHYYGVAPGLSIDKEVNGVDAPNRPGIAIIPGDQATFTYEVSNNGGVTLMDVTVADDQGVVVSCPETVLEPGDSMVCTGSGTAEAGYYTNIGSVVGTPAVPGPDTDTPWVPLVNGDGSTPDELTDEDVANYYGALPGIDITKYVNGHDANDAPGITLPSGDTATWTYVVTNTGNTWLKDVSVSDDQGVEVTCPETILDPGESMTCTGSGIVENGPYVNVGEATGTPSAPTDGGDMEALTRADGSELEPVVDEDPANNFGYENGIKLLKEVFGFDAPIDHPVFSTAGATAPFDYTVTNTGNTWLEDLDIVDDQGVEVTCPTTSLAPGESVVCTGSGVLPKGDYRNIAVVTGVPHVETIVGLIPVTDPETGENIPPVTATEDANVFGESAEIDLTKVACYGGACGKNVHVPYNAMVTWRIEVTNVGNVDLKDLVITDDKVSACDRKIAYLAVGASITIECDASATVARVNTAEVVASPVTEATPETGSIDTPITSELHADDVAEITMQKKANKVLAYTGASTSSLASGGLGLLLVGLFLLLAGKRRERPRA